MVPDRPINGNVREVAENHLGDLPKNSHVGVSVDLPDVVRHDVARAQDVV